MDVFRRTVTISCVLVVFLTFVRGQTCNGGANCIRIQSCVGLYRQLENGATPQFAQLLRSLHCGFENNNNPMICCPPEFLQPIDTRAPAAAAAPPAPPPRSFDPLTLLPNNKVCGIQNNDRIVGGIRTDIDEHPWMALLRYDKPVGWGFYCGGVLISKKYVLTAAHCVNGLPANWKLSKVRLGEWNISSSVDCIDDDCSLKVQDIPIEEIIQHNGYDTEDISQLHDIALLRLSREAQFSDFVKPICLPLAEDLKRSSFDGYDLEVAGWGKTENTSESDVKLKARVPVSPRSHCASVFSKVGRQVTDLQICAGGIGGRDSCRGDSGGPLMGQSPSATNWMVIGIVSYGPSPCGTEGWPGVYTRVGAYIDWILANIRP